MKVVEYWHGTIKNYRYYEDVSVDSAPHSRERAGNRDAQSHDPKDQRKSI